MTYLIISAKSNDIYNNYFSTLLLYKSVFYYHIINVINILFCNILLKDSVIQGLNYYDYF